MTGGVLARASSEGRRTAVVTCTGGELGEIVGRGMDPVALRPRLAEVRREELARSLEILGAGEPRLLGYRDSGMPGTADNDHPDAFWRAAMDTAVGRLVAEIRAFRPAVVVTYDAFGGYGHPDHVQTHRVTVLAVEAAAMDVMYPEAGPAWRVDKLYLATLPRSAIARVNRLLADRGLPSPFGDETDASRIRSGVPDGVVDARVDVRKWLDRKWQALRAHASQVGEDSFFLNTPDDLRAELFGTEWFLRARSVGRNPSHHEDDLFARLAEPSRRG